MKKLAENTLKARAKVLYFDVNPNIKHIFVDEYGRFSYTENVLLELNKKKDVKVFRVNKDALGKVDTSKTNTLKERNEAQAEKDADKKEKK